MMDISVDNSTVRHCYKCDQSSLDNLNIASNPNNSNIILWNKYQIFVYDKSNFNEVIKTIVPDFQISFLIVSNNYLACLDTNGKVHLDAMKFKNAAPKRFKTESKLVEDYNLAFTIYDTDHVLCLKFDTEELRLCLHRFDAEFKILEQITILYDADLSLLQIKRKNIILKSIILSEIKRNSIINVNNYFNVTEDTQSTYSLLIICFDNRTIYFSVFNLHTQQETPLKKLYSCPSEICNIEIINEDDLYVVIGLKSGTIVKLALSDKSPKPQIVHLNIAINNLLVFNDTVLYTDGLSIWKSEKTYSDDIKLTKSSITRVKDFIKLNGQIICTTYTKLIYVFQIDDKEYFVNSKTEEYQPANVILNNSHYLQRIIDEIEKNEVLVKRINEEENYILTLSLSNRQDIMEKIINTNAIVYENYEDAIRENSSITLTERMSAYFKNNTLCILIQICMKTTHEILKQILLRDIKIDITFMSDNKIIKTTSIGLVEQMKNINYLVPLKTKLFRIKVFLILATKIPGAYNEKQIVWNVLYKKEISLNSEHFIKTEEANKNVFLMKSKESLTDLVLNTVRNQYGNIFQFTETNRNVLIKNNLPFYVKLPSNYKDILKTDSYCKSSFHLKKTEFLLQQYSSEEFLNSKNTLLLLVGDNKVNVEIINDSFSSPVLKVVSRNMAIAFDIRNFFANIFYNDFQRCTVEYIKHTFYTVVENNQKALKDCLKTSNIDEMEQQIAHFERNVIGNLPI